MRDHRKDWETSIVVIAAMVGFACAVFHISVSVQELRAQAPAARSDLPQWQIDAGGEKAFEVNSIKPNRSNDPQRSNFPIGNGATMQPVGGLFSVSNKPLRDIIAFAYKLTDSQTHTIIVGLPSWVDSDRFDIEARAEGTPTKDQFRLMAQSLLSERFKLAIHRETRRLPVYALVLARAGKTGTQLVPHSENPPCNVSVGSAQFSPKGFPNPCGQLSINVTPQGFNLGTRNVTMQDLADNLPDIPGVDLNRPLLDRTGLAGAYDLTLFFVIPELRSGVDLPAEVQLPSDTTGPTFLEAFRDQAGLELRPTTGPVEVLVVDHIERPSAN